MNGLNYLLQTNLYLLLFMCFYVLVLRNETFFRQNRFFLNTSIFLSFSIPFINSDWFRDLFITQKVRETAIIPTQMMYDTVIVGINEDTSSLSISNAIFWIYTSGATFLLLRFLVRLAFLKSKLKGGTGAAFSFFNTLVVDKQIPKADTIIDHEKVHMRQWHSADIIFIELAAIVNWFNPVMYLYKKEIRHIHEFIADEEAAGLMQSKSDYALLLFSNTLGVDPLHLSNNFFNKSLLKRRIMMLHKNRSHSTGLWKYGFSAPLFMLMLIISAATVKSEESMMRPVAETLLSPLTPETSNRIMSTLELEEEVKPEEVKIPQKQTVNSPAERQQVRPDYTGLTKHLQRMIRYPASARENNITGYVVATFTVKDKRVAAADIRKSLQKDIDEEVIRSITTFREVLDVPDVTYTVAINYVLSNGGETKSELVPKIDENNYVGQITVVAYNPGSKPAASAAPGRLQEIVINNDESLKDFASVEVLPEPPGGLAGWGKYLTANLKYPKQARDKRTTGRVILSFIVEKDGSLSDIKVLRGVGDGTDEEAVRVIKNSPGWKPGILNGRPVRVAYTMPIFFQLSGNTEEAKPDSPKPPK